MFELILFSFSQVVLIVIILKIYPMPNMLIAATISYLLNISYFLEQLYLHCSNKVIALFYLFLSEGAIWFN